MGFVCYFLQGAQNADVRFRSFFLLRLHEGLFPWVNELEEYGRKSGLNGKITNIYLQLFHS